LANGIAMIAAAFYPKDVIVRQAISRQMSMRILLGEEHLSQLKTIL